MDAEVQSGWLAYLPPLLSGMEITIVLTAITMVAGTVVGFVLAMMRLSTMKPLRFAAVFYTSLVRGLPLLVQVLIVYLALPMIVGLRIPAVVGGTIAMSFYTGGYMSEIIRSGIISVDKGQMEASRSIGFTYWESMRLVVLPQAFWTMLPNLANQFSTTLKNTSILSVIGVMELTMSGQVIYTMNFDTVRVLAMVAALYMAVFLLLERCTAWLERRVARD